MFWLVPIIIAAAWIVLHTFFIMATYERKWFFILLAAGVISYLIIFPPGAFVWLGIVIFTLLDWAYWGRIKSLEKNQLHFSLRQLFAGGLLVMTNALILLMGFNIYHNTSEDFKNNPGAFYQHLSQSLSAGVPKLSSSLPEKFDPNQTLDEYLTRQFESQDPGFSRAGSFEKSALIQQAGQEFLRQFNLKGSGSDTLAQIVVYSFMEKIQSNADGINRFFPLIFTLTVLALLRTFAFLFNWLTMIFGALLFHPLKYLKFFKISKVQVEVDKLTI